MEPDTPALQIVERIRTASNATFLATIDGVDVVYKPVSGERPLWDFPDGTLAHREVAAYLVSEATGWGVVPRTWLRDGPMGPGMVQLWQTVDPGQDPVDVVGLRAAPRPGWRVSLRAVDEHERPVALVHEDGAALRRMAVLDVVVNNADRKGGHVLPTADGHRYGVDHGVTFHAQNKLRTVLWGWQGEPLADDEVAGVARVRAGLDGDLGAALTDLLSGPELTALARRCDRLLRRPRFPTPRGEWPSVPWPLF